MWGWLHFFIISMIFAWAHLQLHEAAIQLMILLVTCLSIYNDMQTSKIRLREVGIL